MPRGRREPQFRREQPPCFQARADSRMGSNDCNELLKADPAIKRLRRSSLNSKYLTARMHSEPEGNQPRGAYRAGMSKNIGAFARNCVGEFLEPSK